MVSHYIPLSNWEKKSSYPFQVAFFFYAECSLMSSYADIFHVFSIIIERIMCSRNNSNHVNILRHSMPLYNNCRRNVVIVTCIFYVDKKSNTVVRKGSPMHNNVS